MQLVSRLVERSMKLPPAHTREVTRHTRPAGSDAGRRGAACRPLRAQRRRAGKRSVAPYGARALAPTARAASTRYSTAGRSPSGVIRCSYKAAGGQRAPEESSTRFARRPPTAWTRRRRIGRQPWFSGDLVTLGPSYMGFVQWALVSALASAQASAPASVPEDTGRATAAWPKAMAVQVAPLRLPRAGLRGWIVRTSHAFALDEAAVGIRRTRQAPALVHAPRSGARERKTSDPPCCRPPAARRPRPADNRGVG